MHTASERRLDNDVAAILTGLHERLIAEPRRSDFECMPVLSLKPIEGSAHIPTHDKPTPIGFDILLVDVYDVEVLVLRITVINVSHTPAASHSTHHPKLMNIVSYKNGPVLAGIRMRPDLLRDALPEPRLFCKPLASHASNRMPAKFDLAWLAVDLGHAMRHDVRCLTESEGVLKASFRLVHFFTTLAEVVFPDICVSFGGQSVDGVRQGDTGRRLSCGSLTAFAPRPALHYAASRVYRACWADCAVVSTLSQV